MKTISLIKLLVFSLVTVLLSSCSTAFIGNRVNNWMRESKCELDDGRFEKHKINSINLFSFYAVEEKDAYVRNALKGDSTISDIPARRFIPSETTPKYGTYDLQHFYFEGLNDKGEERKDSGVFLLFSNSPLFYQNLREFYYDGNFISSVLFKSMRVGHWKRDLNKPGKLKIRYFHDEKEVIILAQATAKSGFVSSINLELISLNKTLDISLPSVEKRFVKFGDVMRLGKTDKQAALTLVQNTNPIIIPDWCSLKGKTLLDKEVVEYYQNASTQQKRKIKFFYLDKGYQEKYAAWQKERTEFITKFGYKNEIRRWIKARTVKSKLKALRQGIVLTQFQLEDNSRYQMKPDKKVLWIFSGYKIVE